MTDFEHVANPDHWRPVHDIRIVGDRGEVHECPMEHEEEA